MAGARTFDWDEAQRLLDSGLKMREVAEIMGVSKGAIEWMQRRNLMAEWACVHYRLPKDLKRALERYAKAEQRSVNSQLIHILKEKLDWRYYEEDEEPEIIFAHPVARHIRRSA